MTMLPVHRRADHPVGLDPSVVQRLVDADLVGAQDAAALQHQHHLARGLPRRSLGCFIDLRRPACLAPATLRALDL
jgi:hypothetical protein